MIFCVIFCLLEPTWIWVEKCWKCCPQVQLHCPAQFSLWWKTSSSWSYNSDRRRQNNPDWKLVFEVCSVIDLVVKWLSMFKDWHVELVCRGSRCKAVVYKRNVFGWYVVIYAGHELRSRRFTNYQYHPQPLLMEEGGSLCHMQIQKQRVFTHLPFFIVQYDWVLDSINIT